MMRLVTLPPAARLSQGASLWTFEKAIRAAAGEKDTMMGPARSLRTVTSETDRLSRSTAAISSWILAALWLLPVAGGCGHAKIAFSMSLAAFRTTRTQTSAHSTYRSSAAPMVRRAWGAWKKSTSGSAAWADRSP